MPRIAFRSPALAAFLALAVTYAIYYCFLSEQEVWLLTLYDKDKAADLTKDEKDQLKKALEAERAARKTRSSK
jgi:hypothetical protein